ncbi:glycosyltransferase family 2 protein [Brevundimonas sp.]|uniref:glycosyltransferase family 2 protein n=1 Tax=Brevundimonas sp. TaxID=1871086 RepID=UPI002FC5CC7A
MAKITVIIPTRERPEVLEYALKTVTSEDYDNLDIVVSDNNSQDHTRDVVESNRDPRIRYVNTGRRLGMTGNWEFALSHVSSGWVTILGDDDGLVPGALQRARGIFEAHPSVRALRSAVCQYQWPTSRGSSHGRIQIPLGSGVELRSARQYLSDALFNKVGYPQLPMLYNGGFIHHEILQSIRGANGNVYHSCAPDVYAAVAVARRIDQYAYSRSPLAINGASRHSTGTSAFSTSATRQSASDKFYQEENIPFHPDLPLLPTGRVVTSMPVLVYEAYLQSAFVDTGPALITQQEVLEVVLADPRQPPGIGDWAAAFASRHGLDLPAAHRKAQTERRSVGVRNAARTVWTALDTYAVGSKSIPIPDVFLAAQAAARVLESPPGRARNAIRLAGSVLRKATGGS